MVQISDSSRTESGSPNDVFSTSITQLEAPKKHRKTCPRTMTVLCALAAVIFLISTVVLAILLARGFGNNPVSNVPMSESETNNKKIPLRWPQPSGSLHAKYKRAAIATDNGLCSEIGRDVLFLGGNAIDATIAALVCVGVVNPQSSGLGGGFIMTIYNSTTGRCTTVDARETAPASANQSMFIGNASDAMTGYRSIAVPSELHGFWTVYKKFGSGKVSWSRLFEPSIQLALNGFPVSSHLAMWLSEKEDEILVESSLKRLFVDPSTERVYEEGDLIKREHLGFTLQLIANSTDPVQLFYQGGLAQTIAAEIEEHGGHITLDDLRSYTTVIDETPIVNDNLPGDLSMCGPPPPSSFAITQSIIAIMSEFYGGKGDVDLDDPLIYHRLIEAQKFAYAQRGTLGDAAFVPNALKLAQNMTTKSYARWIKSLIKDEAQPFTYYTLNRSYQVEDHGTSHVSVIDTHENAVACTSTINQILGSMRVSPTLGIVWNDEMDDFSTPGLVNGFGYAPSEANFIAPGKRPMSSMSPTVIYNKNTGKAKMVVGASGGSGIISAVAQSVIRSLFFNQTIKEAVDGPRFHSQFMPHITVYETTVPKEIIDELITKYAQNMTGVPKLKNVVQALEVREDGFVHGNSDFRRQTSSYPCGF
ncbi:Gamma-glutamyltranspeptidase 1 [Toxocara canis]|uniref:Gamma-glutamyltranspeptidase 1 n=1 Tax=Toxocara canis TaxID=6265 RepID=A0A0B2VJY7_TOXCA|nr:Gamma-glutamyltranspeptidase 1 [Toxocara canis]